MYIDMSKEMQITDPVHGFIKCTGIEQAILNMPQFNRLHHILQSSMLYRTFPGNSVKRFEHSLGVMHLAGELFFSSVSNTRPEDMQKFLAELGAALNGWSAGLHKEAAELQKYPCIQPDALYACEEDLSAAYLPDCGIFRTHTPTNLSADTPGTPERAATWLYYCALQAVRLAGMLHDVGHLPYSHVLETVLKDLHKKALLLPRISNQAVESFGTTMAEYNTNAGGRAFHELMGSAMTNGILSDLMAQVDGTADEKCNISVFVAAVAWLTREILNSDENGNSIFSDLHRLVAGSLDADRMDYCLRDTQSAGTNKEMSSYGRILATIRIRYVEINETCGAEKGRRTERCLFCPSTKAIEEVERLLERRWHIYSTLNYHHRVQKFETLLVRVLTDVGLEELEKGEPSAKLESALPLEVSSIWQIARMVSRPAPKPLLILQLDDSWLETLLNHKYFEAHGSGVILPDDPAWNRFNELVSSTKRYRSHIKRSDDFQRFDKMFFEELYRPEHEAIRNQIPLLQDYDKEDIYAQFSDSGFFIFGEITDFLQSEGRDINSFYERLEKLLNETIRSSRDREKKGKKAEKNLLDCIVVNSRFSLGISPDDYLYVVTGKDETAEPFSRHSSICQVLQEMNRRRPCFNMYYLEASNKASCYQYTKVPAERINKFLAKTAVRALKEELETMKQCEMCGEHFSTK